MFAVVVSVLLISRIPRTLTQSQCFLSNGQCTYNVQLSHPIDGCNRDISTTVLEETQNDRTKKTTDVEKDFNILKDDHEGRLKDLEKTMQKVVLASLDSRTLAGEIPKFNVETKYFTGNVETEERLLSSLHKELKVIREKLRLKSDLLTATDKKLNDTLRVLEISQEGFLQTNRDLLNAEDKVGALLEQNLDLQMELTDKSEKLKVASGKLNETDLTLKVLEITHEETKKSENTLKYELANHKTALNETTVLLNKTLKQYRDLIEKHEETKATLEKRQGELIECYKAKTATFCGFEDFNICGFTQENGTDDFNWTRGRHTTPSSNTGPDEDHTCGGQNGHFMYIEASSRGKGQNAILYSPKYRSLKEQCLEFYYHMYGRNVGILNVYTKAFGNDVSSVWRAAGNQGNYWIVSRLYIPEPLARAGYQIGFEAITDIGFQGDIAIDDVRVNDGPCPSDENARAVIVKVTQPTPDPKPAVTVRPFVSREERKRRRKLKRIRQRIADSLNKTRVSG